MLLSTWLSPAPRALIPMFESSTTCSYPHCFCPSPRALIPMAESSTTCSSPWLCPALRALIPMVESSVTCSYPHCSVQNYHPASASPTDKVRGPGSIISLGPGFTPRNPLLMTVHHSRHHTGIPEMGEGSEPSQAKRVNQVK